MITACAIALLALFSTPLLARRVYLVPGDLDRFDPTVITSFIHIITVVPFLLLAGGNHEFFWPQIMDYFGENRIQGAVVYYGFIQSVSYVCILMGIRSTIGRWIAQRLPVVDGHFSPRQAGNAIAFGVGFGILMLGIVLAKVGGYANFASEMGQRQELLAGSNYFLVSSYNLLLFSVMISAFKFNYVNFKKNMIITCSLMGLAVVSSGMLGGRRGVIQILLFPVILYHNRVQRIAKIPPSFFLICLLIVPYFVAAPLFRVKGATEKYLTNPELLKDDIIEHIDLAFVQLSYVPSYMFVLDYFSSDNIWLGMSYVDLLYAPLPKDLFPNKPPADDGCYLTNLAVGRQVRPGDPISSMNRYSWPPETIGASYMNFWIPGVVIASYMLGVVYKCSYEYMRTNNGIFPVYLYLNAMFIFQFSNLRIMSVSANLAIAATFFWLFFSKPRTTY